MKNGKRIRTLTVLFKNKIDWHQVALFRGAVNSSLEGKANVLFHNHISDGFRYSYPLIQYKIIKDKAAIVCVHEGVDVFGQLVSTNNRVLAIGNRNERFVVDAVIPRQVLVQTWQSMFAYSIRRWLPLNSVNYRKYLELEVLTDRIDMLEKILIGNILSLAKGVGINITEEIKLKIKDIKDVYMIQNKGCKLMAFNVDFICNVSIPYNIGLGKNSSIGFGTIYGDVLNNKKDKHNDNDTEY